MPTFTGFYLTEFLQWTRDHLNTAPLDQLGDALYDDRHASSISVGLYGPLTNNAPVNSSPIVLAGVHTRSFVDDYYYRVHVRPNRIDIGNMMSVQTRDIEVWNARFESNALTDIVATSADGMTLSGPLAPPTSFGPLESRAYTLSVTPDGPPVISAEFSFDFALDTPVLRVIGRRIVGWIFAPDWSAQVIERLEWLTDVMESHDGHEQRVRLREGARRSFEYSALVGSDTERVRMENLLLSWQARVYGLPIWTDVALSDTEITAGATSINVPTANRDFSIGGLVALIHGLDSEFAEITDISPSSLTIKSPLQSSWPVGTKILPARPARVQNGLGISYLSDAACQSTLRFKLEDESLLSPASESPDYLGHPVLLTAPNWADDIESEFSRKINELDFLTGRRAVDDLSGVGTVRRTHRWLIKGRDNIAAFRSWLEARSGRMRPFWLPSFQSDLKVVGTIAASDTAIDVENRGYAANVPAAIGRRDIVIETSAGVRYYRRITGATELSNSVESISIDSAMGEMLLPEQVRRVSFMKLVRLDSDAVEIAHHTDDVIEVSITLRSIRDDI